MSDRQQRAGLTDGPPRAWLIAAIGVAMAAVAGVLVVAAMHRNPPAAPVVIPAVPAARATGPECQGLVSALPEQLGDFRRVTPADPAPPGTAAWQQAGIEQAVVLRCGLDRPSDFVVGSPIQVVNGVQWFQAASSGRSSWFTVDRPVYVALTLPDGSGPTPIQQISDVVAQKMPAVPIDPGPPR